MAWIRACGGGSPAIPDGKTVTPINDVTIWQQCAGIANPTYTTLADVLADTGILQTLIASDNAVDYLVRSKTWAKTYTVPTMTSNTTPSGVCGAQGSSMNATNAWKAFDGSTATAVGKTDDATINNIVYYDFDQNVEINKFDFLSNNANPQKFKAVYSDDLSEWTECSAEINSGSTLQTNIAISSGSGAHRYWGIKQTYSGGNCSTLCGVIQFYSTNLCDNSNAMTYIGQNNYASNTLLADSDWRDAICNSTYFESVLNAKVPEMTSNTTPKGVVSAINYWSTYYPWKAFDGDPSTMWASDTADGVHWLGYEFTEDVCVVMMQYKTRNLNSDYIAKTIDIQCNNADWETVETVTPSQTQGDTSLQTFIFANNISSAKWRAKFINAGGHYSDAYTLQFYGREDV